MKTNVNNIAPDITQTAPEAFDEMYIAVRDKEGRLYNDKQVTRLPDIDKGHKYYKEWKKRKQSSEQLITYLKEGQKPLNILEVGCGNGWLSSKLANIPNAQVTGLDPNPVEIEQAQRVFKKKPNLKFIHGSFDNNTFNEPAKFDVIIFAASIQYFPLIKDTIAVAFSLLTKTGRVHVLDTPFYHTNELEMAAKRSFDYYDSLGFPQMSRYYYHHPLKQVLELKPKTMTDPTTLWNRFTKKNIFYWIILKP